MQDYEKVVLVGHSYGCYLVTCLASAAEANAKVAAVLLIGAGYPVPGYERLRWIFYLPLFVRPYPSWPRLCLGRIASAMWASLTQGSVTQSAAPAFRHREGLTCSAGAGVAAAIPHRSVHQACLPPGDLPHKPSPH